MRTHWRRSLEIITNQISNYRLKIFNPGKAQLFPGFYIVRRLREIRIPVMFPNRLTVFRPGFSTGKSRYILAAACLFAKETSNSIVLNLTHRNKLQREKEGFFTPSIS